MPELISELENVIRGNFPEGETNVAQLIEHCSLYYITTSRNVYFLKKVTTKEVEEVAGVCFFKNDIIYSFAVSMEYQRQGYGKRLLKGVISQLKHVNLTVRSKNTNAISMYEKAGFIFMGIKRNFYRFSSVNDDGIAMSITKK